MKNNDRELNSITSSPFDSDRLCDFILKNGPDEKARLELLIKVLKRFESIGWEKNVISLINSLYNKDGKLIENACDQLIEKFTHRPIGGLVFYCLATIVLKQLLAKPDDDTNLSAVIKWLQSSQCEPLLQCIGTLKPTEVMKILVNKKPRIICYLLHREGQPKDTTLSLLRMLAYDHTCPVEISGIICDIFEEFVHSERWAQIANDILEIANILNPVKAPKEEVNVDTAYLMNWCKHKEEEKIFSIPIPITIQDYISKLDRLITSSSTLKRFQKILQKNRTADFLMLLDHGIKRYRGHDIHQFNVAALGLFFLNTYVENDLTLGEYISRLYEKQFDEQFDVKRNWLLASLLHDHAIPISHMFEIAPHISKVTKANTKDDPCTQTYVEYDTVLHHAYDGLFSRRLFSVYTFFKIDSSRNWGELQKFISKEKTEIGLREARGNELNHGTLGATNMTSMFRKPLDKIVEIAARAIAMHDLKNETISFERDPIAFLLVLCDELQEWGREVIMFPDILIDISSIKIGKFRVEDGKRFFTDDMSVSFRLLQNTELTSFDQHYFEKQKKKFLENRLKFDVPNIFPKIKFGRVTVSKLPCKGDIENELVWSH